MFLAFSFFTGTFFKVIFLFTILLALSPKTNFLVFFRMHTDLLKINNGALY